MSIEEVIWDYHAIAEARYKHKGQRAAIHIGVSAKDISEEREAFSEERLNGFHSNILTANHFTFHLFNRTRGDVYIIDVPPEKVKEMLIFLSNDPEARDELFHRHKEKIGFEEVPIPISMNGIKAPKLYLAHEKYGLLVPTSDFGSTQKYRIALFIDFMQNFDLSSYQDIDGLLADEKVVNLAQISDLAHLNLIVDESDPRLKDSMLYVCKHNDMIPVLGWSVFKGRHFYRIPVEGDEELARRLSAYPVKDCPICEEGKEKIENIITDFLHSEAESYPMVKQNADGQVEQFLESVCSRTKTKFPLDYYRRSYDSMKKERKQNLIA